MKVKVTAENYEEIINKLTIVNTLTFSNGIYILKLSSDKETVVRKFVKE
ncbi:MAG: T9SS type A sorting domain-containing protein [Bacteroidota bacterium]